MKASCFPPSLVYFVRHLIWMFHDRLDFRKDSASPSVQYDIYLNKIFNWSLRRTKMDIGGRVGCISFYNILFRFFVPDSTSSNIIVDYYFNILLILTRLREIEHDDDDGQRNLIRLCSSIRVLFGFLEQYSFHYFSHVSSLSLLKVELKQSAYVYVRWACTSHTICFFIYIYLPNTREESEKNEYLLSKIDGSIREGLKNFQMGLFLFLFLSSFC